MKKLLMTAAALAMLAACHKGTSTNQAMADANSGAPEASASLNNAVANSSASGAIDATKAAAIIKDRHAKYHQIGGAMKAAKRGLDASPADLATIRTSAATIAGLAPQVPSWFPKGTGNDTNPKTGAKPEIWQKADVFAAKAKDFNSAAQAFDAAAKGTDTAAMKTAFGNLGKSCKACHDEFRAEDHDHD